MCLWYKWLIEKFLYLQDLPENFHLHIQNKEEGISKHYPIPQHTPNRKQKSQKGCSTVLGKAYWHLQSFKETLVVLPKACLKIILHNKFEFR